MMKLENPPMMAIKHGKAQEEHDAAKSKRLREFWSWLEDKFPMEPVKVNRKSPAPHPCPECYRVYHEAIRKMLVSFLHERREELANAQQRGIGYPDAGAELMWSAVKYVIAFDTWFEYFEYFDASKADEDDPDNKFFDEDYLSAEREFRAELIDACEPVVLEGAALAKRIGSGSYGSWAEALMKLGEKNPSEMYTVVDDIFDALQRTWGDLRIWIFMNPPRNKKKPVAKARKKKK